MEREGPDWCRSCQTILVWMCSTSGCRPACKMSYIRQRSLESITAPCSKATAQGSRWVLCPNSPSYGFLPSQMPATVIYLDGGESATSPPIPSFTLYASADILSVTVAICFFFMYFFKAFSFLFNIWKKVLLQEQPAADELIGKWQRPLNSSPAATYWAESSALTQKLI